MVVNRFFQVNLRNERSRWRRLSNDLIQGSVLSPILFNLDTSDFLNLKSRRFMFADDWVLIVQKILEEDLKIVDDYFRSIRLLMNPN